MTDEELMAAALASAPEGGVAADGAERGAPRRRAGGRAAHARSDLPPQRPWKQPRMPYKPVEVVSADELESIHQASLRVLAEIGMDFLDDEARGLLKAAGADVRDDSQRVRFDPAMVEERIKTAPSEFTLHAWNPEHSIQVAARNS